MNSYHCPCASSSTVPWAKRVQITNNSVRVSFHYLLSSPCTTHRRIQGITEYMGRSERKDGIRVIFATGAALCLIFVVSWFTAKRNEINSLLRADSALDLANLSLERERGNLEKETKQLGANISSEAVDLRWDALRSQLQGAGASSAEATGVLQGVARAKFPTVKASYSHPPHMWPTLVKEGWVKDKKVWVVHLSYWAPPIAVCGNTSPEEIRGLSLAYRIYVISANAPYQCWIPPLLLQSLPKAEHGAYISDDECMKQYYERLHQ